MLLSHSPQAIKSLSISQHPFYLGGRCPSSDGWSRDFPILNLLLWRGSAFISLRYYPSPNLCSKPPASRSPLVPTPNSHTLASLNFQSLNLLLLSVGSLQSSFKLRPSSNDLFWSLRHHFFLFPFITKCFKNTGCLLTIFTYSFSSFFSIS